MKPTTQGKSRRRFMKQAVLGAGATAATLGAGTVGLTAAEEDDANPIRVPAEFESAKTAPLPTVDFPMTGAQVFARACKEEGVAALFCCPGNYTVVHAISDTGIPTYGGRHEGALCHAADAFCRVTGEIAATSGTEGPGFTDMICGIATANAGAVAGPGAGQQQDHFRRGHRARDSGWLSAADDRRGAQVREAAHHGRPHPRVCRLRRSDSCGAECHSRSTWIFRPRIASARFQDASEVEYFYDKTKYRTDTKPHPDPQAIDRAVALIRAAERPIIVSSNGVFYGRAWDALRSLAERAQIPVVESGATKGQFPADHELSVDAAPGALASADLVLLVGQYCMPTLGEFAFGPDAKYIRIDPSAEDIGRNLPIDLGIVSDERAALEALADAVPRMRHQAWVAEVAAARADFEAENEEYYQIGLGYTDAVHPAVIGRELNDFLQAGGLPRDRTTIVQGGYGIARYTRRYLRAFRPGQIMNGAYQYGAIGPDVGYTLGVAAAVQQGSGPQADFQGHPVIGITGDAGFGYTGMEIETMAKYRLPAIVIVYNNNAWGTWNGQRDNQIGLPVHLFQENVRYDKMGEALGAHGEYVTQPAQFRPALDRAYQVALDERRPSVINVQAKKEFWLRDQYPPGFLGKIEPGVMSYYH